MGSNEDNEEATRIVGLDELNLTSHDFPAILQDIAESCWRNQLLTLQQKDPPDVFF